MTLPPGEVLVFVYGTFLRGEPHHHLLERARFVRSARTEAAFRLVDMGDFPAIVAPGDGAVEGEVYAVGAALLELLDEFEDHPSYYRRTPISLDDGSHVEAYVLPDALAEGSPTIASGSWKQRTACA